MEVLLQYKEIISIGIAFVLEILVFLIFKRRPKIVDNSFVAKLCDWIKEAEDLYKVGSDKMEYVLTRSADYLGKSFVEKDVRALIEYILTVPEKKEKK